MYECLNVFDCLFNFIYFYMPCPGLQSQVTHRKDCLLISVIHQLPLLPICFYLKLYFPSLGPSGADRDYFWLRSLLSSSLPSPVQTGTCGAATKASSPGGSYSEVFVLNIHQGFLADSLPTRAPPVLGQGGSAACFYIPSQRATSPNLIVSHGDWTGKQLWAAKFNGSHFRK